MLADYEELYQLRKDVKTLIENNDGLKSTLETMLDQLANPLLRSMVFAIADALAGGTPAAISLGGGGVGNSDSDLRWDGRSPNEEDEAYRRRCLETAIILVMRSRSNMAKIECSNRLRVILAEKEITNRWLAEQMGVTDMTVSRWKTNKVQPSMAQFVEIAQLLKVDIKDLIEADFNYDIE